MEIVSPIKQIKQIHGTFCRVYQQGAFAIKEIRRSEKESQTQTQKRDSLIQTKHILNEIAFFQTILPHPNIIHPLHISLEWAQDSIQLQFPWFEFSLDKWMGSLLPSATLQDVQSIMKQILAGVSHLHRHCFVHRDIKPNNILIRPHASSKWEVVLIDFGYTTQLANKNAPRGLSNWLMNGYYRAPELYVGRTDYTEQVDVWSIGCIFFELLSGGNSLLDWYQHSLFELLVYFLMPFQFKWVLDESVPELNYEAIDQAIDSCSLWCSSSTVHERDLKVSRGMAKLYFRQCQQKILQDYDKSCQSLRSHPFRILLKHQSNQSTAFQAILIDFLQRVLHIDPEQRLSSFEITQHPFFHYHTTICSLLHTKKTPLLFFESKTLSIQQLFRCQSFHRWTLLDEKDQNLQEEEYQLFSSHLSSPPHPDLQFCWVFQKPNDFFVVYNLQRLYVYLSDPKTKVTSCVYFFETGSSHTWETMFPSFKEVSTKQELIDLFEPVHKREFLPYLWVVFVHLKCLAHGLHPLFSNKLSFWARWKQLGQPILEWVDLFVQRETRWIQSEQQVPSFMTRSKAGHSLFGRVKSLFQNLCLTFHKNLRTFFLCLRTWSTYMSCSKHTRVLNLDSLSAESEEFVFQSFVSALSIFYVLGNLSSDHCEWTSDILVFQLEHFLDYVQVHSSLGKWLTKTTCSTQDLEQETQNLLVQLKLCFPVVEITDVYEYLSFHTQVLFKHFCKNILDQQNSHVSPFLYTYFSQISFLWSEYVHPVSCFFLVTHRPRILTVGEFSKKHKKSWLDVLFHFAIAYIDLGLKVSMHFALHSNARERGLLMDTFWHESWRPWMQSIGMTAFSKTLFRRIQQDCRFVFESIQTETENSYTTESIWLRNLSSNMDVQQALSTFWAS